VNRSVYPSAGALTAASTPTLVPPPGLFSMTTCWPRQPLSHEPLGGAARWKRDNPPYRPRWIGLCEARARKSRASSEPGEEKKPAAPKQHRNRFRTEQICVANATHDDAQPIGISAFGLLDIAPSTVRGNRLFTLARTGGAQNSPAQQETKKRV
jgi:hypothetical protein